MVNKNTKDVRSLLSAMKSNSELLSQLYERRGVAIRMSSLLDIEEEDIALARLKDFDLVEVEGDMISITPTLETFFDSTLDVAQEISIAGIKESMEYLAQHLDDYEDENIKEKGKVVKSIRGQLRKLSRTLSYTYRVMRYRILLEFENQDDFYKKRKELDRYRKKVTELDEAKEYVYKRLAYRQRTFESIVSSEVHGNLSELYLVLNEITSSLVYLQKEVIAYLYKLEEKKKFVDRLFELAGMIRNQEILYETNIEELVDKLPLRVDQNIYKIPHLHGQINAEDDELLEFSTVFDELVVKSLDDAGFNKEKKEDPKERQVATDSACFGQREIVDDDEDIDALFSTFREQRRDLFGFILYKKFDKEKTLTEKIDIFVQTAILYEKEITIDTEDRIMHQGYNIAKISYKEQR